MTSLQLVPLDTTLADVVVTWAATREEVTVFGGAALPHPLRGADLLATVHQGWQPLAMLRDGTPVATGSVRRVDEHTARIGRILLDPSLRGQGLGRATVQALVANAGSLDGVTAVTLGVFEHNTPARRLYGSLGFRATGPTRVHHVDGQAWTARDMVLRLG